MMEELNFRKATKKDVSIIVRMLADDDLGSTREEDTEQVADGYYDAFEQIDKDHNNELTIAEYNGKIIGTLQITFIPYLTYKGGMRALIEAVRIDSEHRGKGFGRKLFEYAINRAQDRGCHMVQLTTNKKRTDAFKFYESLGFEATHEGMKLFLKTNHD
jgi:GNAT superfamily N-acetyltransferase